MKLALCKSRHRFPRDCRGFIFEHEIKEPYNLPYLDWCVRKRFTKPPYRIDVYVTGLTTALVAVINYCYKNNVWLVLWHYRAETKEYYPQSVNNFTKSLEA